MKLVWWNNLDLKWKQTAKQNVENNKVVVDFGLWFFIGVQQLYRSRAISHTLINYTNSSISAVKGICEFDEEEMCNVVWYTGYLVHHTALHISFSSNAEMHLRWNSKLKHCNKPDKKRQIRPKAWNTYCS